MGEDDEGLVKIATRQVICAGELGYGSCPPLTHRLPDLVRCERCGADVRPTEAIYYDGHAPPAIRDFEAFGNSGFLMQVNPPAARVTARTAPHYRTERLQLRWVSENEEAGYEEDRFETAPIPEGPEWEFTDG